MIKPRRRVAWKLTPFSGVPGVPADVLKWAERVHRNEGSEIHCGQWKAVREWDDGPVTFWLQVGEARRRKRR